MKISVTIPDDTDPKTVDALEAAIEKAGGTWEMPTEEPDMGPEEPGEMMPPGQAGQMMAQKGAFALRPPGLG